MPDRTRKLRIKIKDSIAYHLLKVVFAIYFFFAVSITGYHMYLEYTTVEDQIVLRLGLIEDAFKDSLSKALFDLDSEQLHSILMGLNEMQALVGVSLRKSNPDIFIPDAGIGIIIDPTGKDTIKIDKVGIKSKSSHAISELIVHNFKLYQPGTDTEIADGTLYSSSNVVFNSVKGSFARLVASAIIKTALLWLLFLWAAGGRLSEPLRQFSDHISKVDLDNDEIKRFRVKKETRRDELKTMSAVFFRMQLRLRRYVNELRNERKAADQAKLGAEKANLAKSEFLSMMSHELRTPLTASMGSLGLLNSLMPDETSEENRDLLDIAIRNNKSLLRLVNELLDYDKLLSGKLLIETSKHEICALTSNIVNDLQGYAQVQSVNFILTENTSPIYVETQEYRFEQILNNLLSNAAKFSEPGADVMISISRVNEYVCVRVKDSGPGVPEELREKIYEQFVQADSSATRKHSGTGLGLAISKSLVEAMGGKIDFETEMGVGSTFFFFLPVSE